MFVDFYKFPVSDVEILKEFDGENCPKDNIKLVYCQDGHKNGELCINAFLHRKYCDVIGYLCRPEFLINYSDNWLFESFKAVSRLKYRPDIFIYHNHWTYGRPIDNTVRRMLADNRLANADKNGKNFNRNC